jgi:hypothetical protein
MWIGISARLQAHYTSDLRDCVEVSAGTYQSAFTLKPGSYVCPVVLREQTTGRIFGETIHFDVK